MDRGDLANLTAFVAVADQRSFRAAASRLGVTPSALSHSMRQLEERLAGWAGARRGGGGGDCRGGGGANEGRGGWRAVFFGAAAPAANTRRSRPSQLRSIPLGW